MTDIVKPVSYFVALPRSLAVLMRREAPDAIDEIISEVQRAIPEYDRPLDGPYGEVLKASVGEALKAFIDLVADPSAPHDQRDEAFRRLGHLEAAEGRTLDDLQAAYRIGANVAWRRLAKLTKVPEISATIMFDLADAVFAYTNELASLSVQGYREALARSKDAHAEQRRRLVRLILENPPAPRQAIAELAELVGWTLPSSITPVAVSPCPPVADVDSEVALLHDDVLVDLSPPRPMLLVPGPITEDRQVMLKSAMKSRRIAIGPSIPLGSALVSMRWAREALNLAEGGVIDDQPVIECERHLIAIWLMSDPDLANQIVERQMALMGALTEAKRRQVTETFTAWFETKGRATEIAQQLDLHPQTIRKRLKKFQDTLGDVLADPEERFALEVALRVMNMRKRITAKRDAGR